MNPAPMPVIAAFYAGLIGLMLLVLAIPVSRLRHSLKVGLGDGGNVRLTRAIRAHANTVEWALPTLLLLLLAELNRAPSLALHACGIALVVGRVLHAVGLSSTGGSSFGRFVGTSLTWAALLVLALWDIWAFVRLAMV
jgi:uncharacterized membrane protein YecN with MAPEG domain